MQDTMLEEAIYKFKVSGPWKIHSTLTPLGK